MPNFFIIWIQQKTLNINLIGFEQVFDLFDKSEPLINI